MCIPSRLGKEIKHEIDKVPPKLGGVESHDFLPPQAKLDNLPLTASGVGEAITPVMEEMARAAWVRRVNFILIEVV